jgi:hypothetical protein
MKIKTILSLSVFLSSILLTGCEELSNVISDAVAELPSDGNTSISSSTDITTIASTESVDKLTDVIEGFPSEYAIRAGIVALTNYYALDVFAPDGNSYDTSKFHKFSDTAGAENYFWEIVNTDGCIKKNENTYRIINLELKSYEYGSVIEVSFDVTYDGTNYVVSKLEGIGPSQMDLSYIEQEIDSQIFLIVSPDKIVDGRDSNKVGALDNSGKLSQNEAKEIFEDYCEILYPYGVKCHWFLDFRAAEQYTDGSWFLKVGITVKNANGEERDIVAEGTVNSDTHKVEGFYGD